MTTEQKRELVVQAMQLMFVDARKRGDDDAPARTLKEAVEMLAEGLGTERFAQLRGLLLYDVISSIDVGTLITFAEMDE